MEHRLQRQSQRAQAEHELFLSSSSSPLGKDRGTVLMSEREKGDANRLRRELLKKKRRYGEGEIDGGDGGWWQERKRERRQARERKGERGERGYEGVLHFSQRSCN